TAALPCGYNRCTPRLAPFSSEGASVMVSARIKVAAAMPILGALFVGALAVQAGGTGAGAGSRGAEKPAPMIAADRFDELRALIKPKPGGFDDLPWMTDLWEARKKAAAEGKPLFVWVGDGHPLGWT